MNVLVVGGSGFIGTTLVPELLDRDHEVAVLSRNPDTAALPEAVERVSGDVTAYDSIESAFEGRDAVVNLVALSPLFEPPGDLTHESIHLGGTENAVAAAESHDVDRFLQLSALGADPDGETAYIRAKGAAETAVRESTLDWVLFRPSVVFGDGGEFVSFTKRLTPGPVLKALPGGGKTKFQPIWVGDLVLMLADALERDEHIGETYEIGGPEVLTLADVTRLAYSAEGKAAKIAPVPMPLAKLGLTIAGPLPFVPMGPDQARSLQFDNTTADNDAAVFTEPSDLKTLEAYLRG